MPWSDEKKTSDDESILVFSSDAQTLEEGYEILRQHVLSNAGRPDPAPGLGIFLRQGMVTWMKAYSLCSPTLPFPPPCTGDAEVPAGLVGEITTILTGIVLARKEIHL